MYSLINFKFRNCCKFSCLFNDKLNSSGVHRGQKANFFASYCAALIDFMPTFVEIIVKLEFLNLLTCFNIFGKNNLINALNFLHVNGDNCFACIVLTAEIRFARVDKLCLMQGYLGLVCNKLTSVSKILFKFKLKLCADSYKLFQVGSFDFARV